MCNECTQKYGGDDDKTGMCFISFMLCMSRTQFGSLGVHDDTIIVRKWGVGLGYLCFVISQCYSPFTLSVNLNTESVSLLFPLMSFFYAQKRGNMLVSFCYRFLCLIINSLLHMNGSRGCHFHFSIIGCCIIKCHLPICCRDIYTPLQHVYEL